MRLHSLFRCGSIVSFCAAAMGTVTIVHAQATTTTTGFNLALRSAGTRNSTTGTATLNEPGYVGTYVTLAAPGAVTLTVNAQGSAGAPQMNIVVDDYKTGWSVGSAASAYTTTYNLPAGTHFIRTETTNASASNPLTIQNLQVTGATVSNTSTNANALAAANTYINNFRKGSAKFKINGATGRTPIHFSQVHSDFHFGTAVSAANLSNATYSQRLKENFNSVTPGNDGKWASNEPSKNVLTLSSMDRVLDFAQTNGMRSRMHNLIWGSQQPAWVNTLIANSSTGSLSAAIDNRRNYYVRDRAAKYAQLDVYNESFHTGAGAAGPNYWSLYGAAGIADIHNKTAQSVAQAGANTKLFVNEYNVLQDGSDAYARWYLQHTNAIRNAGGKVDGIGVQWYSANSIGASNSQENPARAFAALQNLSIGNTQLELTEFGVKTGGTLSAGQPSLSAQAADITEDAMRIAYGTPAMTGFTAWGFWANDMWSEAPAAALYDANWNLTDVGRRYQSLLLEWTTDLRVTADPDGTFEFTGFYGDYEAIIGGQKYFFTFDKGTSSYTIHVPEPSGAMVAAAVVALFARRRRRRLLVNA